MSKYIRLSYDIETITPLYPGTPPVEIKRVKDIKKGDACNTSLVTFSNHAGTHIDTPAHFASGGKAINAYSIEELVFRKPVIINCPKEPEGIIEIEDLSALTASQDADVLLIRTGFHKYRSDDAGIYCYRNPCLSPRAARWIREKFPSIRAVGIDCVSIASFAHRRMGRETHEALLKENGFKGSPVIIIEGLYLPDGIDGLDKLIISPVFIGGVDSAPCTVIGIRND